MLGPTLRLYNARGSDRAEEVEVYVDVGWEFEPTAVLPHVEQELMSFGDPRTRPAPATARNVAPGFARWLPFLILGDASTLAQQYGLAPDALPDDCVGVIATARADGGRPAWVNTGQEYWVSITITGANFDAITYDGRFVIDVADIGRLESIQDARSIDVDWTHVLKRVGHTEPPTRLATPP